MFTLLFIKTNPFSINFLTFTIVRPFGLFGTLLVTESHKDITLGKGWSRWRFGTVKNGPNDVNLSLTRGTKRRTRFRIRVASILD